MRAPYSIAYPSRTEHTSVRQCFDHRVYNRVGFGTHFIIRCILDGMWNEQPAGIVHAQCLGLCLGGFLELCRSKRD